MKKENKNRTMRWLREWFDDGLIPFSPKVFHLVMLLSLLSNQLFAQIIRPHVSEVEGWKKCGVSHLTGDWDDNRKIIWCYTGEGKGDQKKYIGAFVVRIDNDG